MSIQSPVARKWISALGALVIGLGAITASAAPARANGEDVAKVIAGVAALAIIGTAINKANKAEARPGPGWHQQRPGKPGWHQPQPPRQQQNCVQAGRGGQIVCGRPVNNAHGRPHQPPRHGWNNNRPRHNGGFYSNR